MAVAIEVRSLSKVFESPSPVSAWLRPPWRPRRRITALEGLSLTVQSGEFICVMGSNGAGKTTLLKILAGLVLPTGGTASIEGRDICARPRALNARIGYAAGDPPGFYDLLTGRQNLLFFAALYGLRGQAAARRVDSLCERLGVEAPEQRYQECSAGMKQRLALARTLVHDPPVLLLDEPLRHLDPVRAERLHELLKQELSGRMGKTILLTTHRASEAERLADRVVILHRGALKGCGSVAELAGGGGLEAAIRERCAT